jgi:hypothetical protein
MHFFQTIAGNLVNERFVAEIVHRDNKTTSLLLASDGTALGEIYRSEAAEPQGAVIAANRDTFATVFMFVEKDADTPEDTVDARQVPVIAWRVLNDSAAPIFLESLAINELAMFAQPNGSFVHPDNMEYVDFNAALAGAVEFFSAERRERAAARERARQRMSA